MRQELLPWQFYILNSMSKVIIPTQLWWSVLGAGISVCQTLGQSHRGGLLSSDFGSASFWITFLLLSLNARPLRGDFTWASRQCMRWVNRRRPKSGAQRLQEVVLLSFGAEERASSSTERSPLTAPLLNSAVGLLQQVCSDVQNESR